MMVSLYMSLMISTYLLPTNKSVVGVGSIRNYLVKSTINWLIKYKRKVDKSDEELVHAVSMACAVEGIG